MKFDAKGYYIERYIKCHNCGVLIYGDGVRADDDAAAGGDADGAGEEALYCSDWCIEWRRARAAGVENPMIPLPKDGINTTQ